MNYNMKCEKHSNLYYNDVDVERLTDQYYSHVHLEKEECVTCDGCGEYLIDGDVYYPDIGVCEYCLQNYKVIVRT